MLSKGGKVSYYCTSCTGYEIEKVGGPNVYHCTTCGHTAPWGTRGKHSSTRTIHECDVSVGSIPDKNPRTHLPLTVPAPRDGPVEYKPVNYAPPLAVGMDSPFSSQVVIPSFEKMVKEQANSGDSTLDRSNPLTDDNASPVWLALEDGVMVGAVKVLWGARASDDFTQWTHRPDSFGIWTHYNNWRFKDHYDILLRDGRVFMSAYPNGSSFHVSEKCKEHGRIDERMVVATRLTTFDDITKWARGGDDEEESNLYRARRNAEMFGDSLCDWDTMENVIYLEEGTGDA